MDQLAVGDRAPDFSAPVSGGGTVRLSQLRGGTVVLYFYPRDGTAGCTREACDFRDARDDFAAVGCTILGVSADSVWSHEKFRARHGLPFQLVCDRDHAICEAYGVWREKVLFGRRYKGTVRTTFVIDGHGMIRAVFDRVRVRGHVARVLQSVAGERPL